ncbi:MAG: molecular chaperone DnaJ [Candidatus Obscuribacterales bacterium]|nr:molecular chaperone DnaJ [Candidatus Obscuribacterales bacterium]
MVNMATRDYYEILGVSKTATADEIKKAFRKTAAKLHPDNKDTGDEAAFKELVTAYEVLSEDEKRQIYDKYGAEGLKRGGGGGQGFSSDFDPSAFGGLDEILEFFFSGGMRGGRTGGRPPARGNDLRYDLELNFNEAVFGVEKKFNIKHLRPCTACSGSGAAPGCQPVVCTGCGGHGQVRQTRSTFFGHFSQVVPCPTCNGEGTRVEKACDACQGKALIRQPRAIELKIPAGVDNGNRIRVPNEGDSGRKGAGPGDLYVICHVKDHEKFIREGTTVHLKQSISPSMAALGGEMLIDTVGGKRITKIPAGTQTGTIQVLKGEGIPFLNSERRGDQQVHIFVEVPTKLSDEEKALYKQLADLRNEALVVPESERPVVQKDEKDDKKEHQSIFDAIAGVFKGKSNAE